MFRTPALKAILLFSLIACGEPEPIATGTKTKPSVSSSDTPSPAPANGGNAAKGQTALTTSCTGCHASSGSAHVLVQADASKLDAAASKSYHKSVSAAFTSSAADIKAYLLTIP